MAYSVVDLASDIKINIADRAEFFNSTNRSLMTGFEQIASLTVGVSRTVLERSTDVMRRASAVKDSREFLTLNAGELSAMLTQLSEYSQIIARIASSTNLEISSGACEHIAKNQRDFLAAWKIMGEWC